MYVTLPGEWRHMVAVAASLDALYAVEDRVLYPIDFTTGAATRLDDQCWSTHLVARPAALYSFERHAVYRLPL
jgi:hypothetical protein